MKGEGESQVSFFEDIAQLEFSQKIEYKSFSADGPIQRLEIAKSKFQNFICSFVNSLSFLNLPLWANFNNNTDLSHTSTTVFRTTSTQPQLLVEAS